MNKNALIAALGLAVVVLVAVVFWPKGSCQICGKSKTECVQGCNHNPCTCNVNIGETNVISGVTNVVVETITVIDGVTNTVREVAPLVRSVERRPLEPEATKRLHDGPVVVSSLFEASGKAEHASYGKAIRGSYLYTTTVKARSEIVSKEENETTGSVRVVEKRTFLQSRDHLALSDLDVVVALDTLPVGQVKSFVDGIVTIVGGIATLVTKGVAAPVVAKVKVGIEAAFRAIHTTDGQSARGMLGLFGVDIPENLEVFVNDRLSKYVGKQLSDVHVALQSIEGKSYLITYTQAANGMPLNVDFTREGGGPITEAEWEILRSANAFLDSNAVPDARCRVGDSWSIWADEVQELFGAAGEGRAEGKIRVERVDDQPDGTWTLRVEPSEILFRSNAGTAAGSMQVKDGNGLVDAENASVKTLHATATGNLASLNKKRHAMFFDFVKRLNGDSNLRFTLTVDPE